MDIQSLVDQLCEAVNCSVAVDDAQMQLIAASAQIGLIDSPRSEAVLNRNTPSAVAAYGLSKVIGRGPEPFTVPASSELNTLPRWCFPLHQGNDTLGYLWLINEPELSSTDIALAAEYAERMVLILAATHREITETAQQSEHYLSRMLRSKNLNEFQHVLSQSPLPEEGSVILWCFDFRSDNEQTNLHMPGPNLARVVDRVLSDPLTPSMIASHFDGHLAIATRTTRTADHIERLLVPAVQRASIKHKLVLSSWGRKRVEERQLASEAWDQAVFSATVAGLSAMPAGSDWQHLGIWSLLYKQELSSNTMHTISPRSSALVKHENQALWKTLLQYLDCATDIPATATALHIERSTLYYRLNRVREIAGPDIIDDGWERTSAHVALTLHRALNTWEIDSYSR